MEPGSGCLPGATPSLPSDGDVRAGENTDAHESPPTPSQEIMIESISQVPKPHIIIIKQNLHNIVTPQGIYIQPKFLIIIPVTQWQEQWQPGCTLDADVEDQLHQTQHQIYLPHGVQEVGKTSWCDSERRHYIVVFDRFDASHCLCGRISRYFWIPLERLLALPLIDTQKDPRVYLQRLEYMCLEAASHPQTMFWLWINCFCELDDEDAGCFEDFEQNQLSKIDNLILFTPLLAPLHSPSRNCFPFVFSKLHFLSSFRAPTEIDPSRLRCTGHSVYSNVLTGILDDRTAVVIPAAVSDLSRAALNRVVGLLKSEFVLDFRGWIRQNEVISPVFEGFSSTIAQNASNPLIDFTMRRKWLLQIALGLDYLHSHITSPVFFGTLSSATVLLTHEGDVKLPHPGLLESVRDPRFMAPELLGDQSRAASAAADVYSFGMIAYHILAGEEPFSGLPEAEVARHVQRGERPEVGGPLGELVAQCGDTDPDSRPTAAQLVVSLPVLSLSDSDTATIQALLARSKVSVPTFEVRLLAHSKSTNSVQRIVRTLGTRTVSHDAADIVGTIHAVDLGLQSWVTVAVLSKEFQESEACMVELALSAELRRPILLVSSDPDEFPWAAALGAGAVRQLGELGEIDLGQIQPATPYSLRPVAEKFNGAGN
eukprot:TRINITY_DN153_c0_g1_i16.p1 TRINITY_DN153_c0_g1~~TRINITY_DN153_c0_g1_i16.p1  ORF type:complete len:654 (-),score=122.03 TRINITY_DN153_c0_g1_i16:114-2075(-)